MKSSTRYSLIGLGIVIFLILAPALILYVSGHTVSFSGDTNATGILDAKSNPSGAKLLIDGKEHSSTPAIARFLNQGEYLFTVSKDGYYDWSKRLPIESGQVTYAQEGVTELQLIKKSSPVTIAPEKVSSFALVNDTVWFARDNNIVYAPLNDSSSQTVIPVNFAVKEMTLLRDKAHLYIGNETLIDTNTKTLVHLPGGTYLTADDIAIAPNGTVLYLSNFILYAFDVAQNKATPLNQRINSFTLLNNTGYFIEQIAPNSREYKITSASWNGTQFEDTQTLVESGSIVSKNILQITDNKELFCHCGGELYRVGNELEPIASQVLKSHLDLNTNELYYQTASELGFYNFLTSKPQLFSRSTNPTLGLIIHSSIGYGFIATNTGLEALEIDPRFQQNNYQLLNQDQSAIKPVWQIALSQNQKTILALQDGSLVKLDIRN